MLSLICILMKSLYSLSKHWAHTVWVAPHFFTTPSPGGHCRQHSPLSVYWPESQETSTARWVFDVITNATWHSGTVHQKGTHTLHNNTQQHNRIEIIPRCPTWSLHATIWTDHKAYRLHLWTLVSTPLMAPRDHTSALIVHSQHALTEAHKIMCVQCYCAHTNTGGRTWGERFEDAEMFRGSDQDGRD